MNLGTIHANASPDWFTPPEWLAWVEATLGKGYHDPCPPGWTPECGDGLEVPWGDQCYVNHPGGRRGAAQPWWDKAWQEQPEALIWCLFSMEQLWRLDPSPLELPGWLVMPQHKRIGFVWGGPNVTNARGVVTRTSGEVSRSPANYTSFWTTARPARPPCECIVICTGAAFTMVPPA